MSLKGLALLIMSGVAVVSLVAHLNDAPSTAKASEPIDQGHLARIKNSKAGAFLVFKEPYHQGHRLCQVMEHSDDTFRIRCQPNQDGSLGDHSENLARLTTYVVGRGEKGPGDASYDVLAGLYAEQLHPEK